MKILQPAIGAALLFAAACEQRRSEPVLVRVEQAVPQQPVVAPASPVAPSEPAANGVEGDRFASINQALERAGLPNRVVAMGVWLNINGDGCDDAMLRRVALNPAALALLLGERMRYIRCADSDNEQRLPLPGSIIPDSVAWDRSYVTTPTTMSGAGRAEVFCTGMARTPWVMCHRTLAACLADREQIDGIEAARSCTPARKLWCYETGGTELQCALSRRDCNAARDNAGSGAGVCSERWAF